MSDDEESLTYRDAGVDIAAGEFGVERIKAHVRSTFRSEVVGDVGGFGGIFAFDVRRHRDPLLVSSTDSIGTKAIVSRQTGRYDTVGVDLVAMCADDVAVQGAEPLYFLDCISTGHLEPDVVDQIVRGIARGCREAGCSLIGGEMAEIPGILDPDEFDLIGFATGVVERDELLPRDSRPGDRIIGLRSPGLRCNGYVLARKALLERAGRSLDGPAWDGAEHSLADELMLPSVIYARALLAIRDRVEVRAFAHVTGGGIPANLVRVLPEHRGAVVRRGTWDEPRIFAEIQRTGNVADAEMEQVFNLGLGMLALVPDGEVNHTLDVARSTGHEAWEVGEIVEGEHVVIERD